MERTCEVCGCLFYPEDEYDICPQCLDAQDSRRWYPVFDDDDEGGELRRSY